jgi:hypothetical protein
MFHANLDLQTIKTNHTSCNIMLLKNLGNWLNYLKLLMAAPNKFKFKSLDEVKLYGCFSFFCLSQFSVVASNDFLLEFISI